MANPLTPAQEKKVAEVAADMGMLPREIRGIDSAGVVTTIDGQRSEKVDGRWRAWVDPDAADEIYVDPDDDDDDPEPEPEPAPKPAAKKRARKRSTTPADNDKD